MKNYMHPLACGMFKMYCVHFMSDYFDLFIVFRGVILLFSTVFGSDVVVEDATVVVQRNKVDSTFEKNEEKIRLLHSK